MAKNSQFHGQSKHIGIKYHFIRDQVKDGSIELKYCPTEEIVADMLTNGLYGDRFVKLRDMSGVGEFIRQ